MKKKGSVTVFLCLFLVVFLGFMQVFFRIVQISGGRVQAIAGVQEGLYSVFAGYDKELFEKYHVFFVDGTYNTGNLNLGQAYDRIREKIERSCSPQIKNLSIRGENLWNCYFSRGEITGYTLATDRDGQSFKKQAINYMTNTLGIQGMQLLLEQVQNEKNKLITEDGNLYLKDGKHAQENYETERRENTDTGYDNVPKDFVNPLETIKEIKKKGILSLVLPLSVEVSQNSVVLKELPSVREIEVGLKYEEDVSESILDHLLFQEYIMKHMNCYTDSSDEEGLVYEVEYILSGKSSDLDNLKSVVTKLIGVREAANMAYLMKDSLRQAQLHQMALLICTAVGLPAIEGVVSLALAAAWSFGESVLDVRQLLAGGCVPFIKTNDTWKLSLENLSELATILKNDVKIEQTGMSYKEYLRILLGIHNENQQVNRTIDLVEHTIRMTSGREGFRMDCCFDYMEVNMYVLCNGIEYEILRDYGYHM